MLFYMTCLKSGTFFIKLLSTTCLSLYILYNLKLNCTIESADRWHVTALRFQFFTNSERLNVCYEPYSNYNSHTNHVHLWSINHYWYCTILFQSWTFLQFWQNSLLPLEYGPLLLSLVKSNFYLLIYLIIKGLVYWGYFELY